MMRIREKDAFAIRQGIEHARRQDYARGALFFLFDERRRNLYSRAYQRTVYGLTHGKLRAEWAARARSKKGGDAQ